MIKHHVTTQRCDLSPIDEREIERFIARLERRLPHVDDDLVHLTIAVEYQPRRDEYEGSIRLTLFNRVLRAKRNAGPTIQALLKQAFDDLDGQLTRFMGKLRRDFTYQRKRPSIAPETARMIERDMLAKRELLDRALAGNREAFNALVDTELPILSRAIASALVERQIDPSPEAIEHVMADVLVIAARDLAKKPARWSLSGWLAWLARREIEREANRQAVAQSAEP